MCIEGAFDNGINPLFFKSTYLLNRLKLYIMSQFKKYRIIYTFNNSKFGFQNSVTVISLNVDMALKDAEKQVSEVYGSKMLKRFSFKPDPVYNGVSI